MDKSNALITFLPADKSFPAPPQLSVLQLGTKARVRIPTRCQGVAGCLMCKIIVTDPSALNPVTDAEKAKLGPLIDQGYRLACQTRVIADVTVTVPEDRLKSVVASQLAKLRNGEETDTQAESDGGDWDEWVVPEKYR